MHSNLKREDRAAADRACADAIVEEEFTEDTLMIIQRVVRASLPTWLYIPLRNAVWRKGMMLIAIMVDSFNELRGADFSNAPPIHICLEYGKANRMAYVASGRPLAEMLRWHMQKTGISPPSGAPILDFGCGAGRVLEAFGHGYTCFGCDINPRPIGWIQKYRPEWTVCVNEVRPPLPQHFREMDLVYAISVFTHMSQTDAEAWARHLHGVLKPRGWLLATVLDPSQEWAIQKFRVERAVLQALDFYYEPERNIAFLTRDYLTSRWGEYFELVDYGPAHGYRQTMAVLRRRP